MIERSRREELRAQTRLKNPEIPSSRESGWDCCMQQSQELRAQTRRTQPRDTLQPRKRLGLLQWDCCIQLQSQPLSGTVACNSASPSLARRLHVHAAVPLTSDVPSTSTLIFCVSDMAVQGRQQRSNPRSFDATNARAPCGLTNSPHAPLIHHYAVWPHVLRSLRALRFDESATQQNPVVPGCAANGCHARARSPHRALRAAPHTLRTAQEPPALRSGERELACPRRTHRS
eukprot:1495594-Prymnesium_polylepis.1